VTSWITTHATSGTVIKSKKYTNFPAIIEDIDAGNLDATFLLAPLAMKVARSGKTPVKIVHLGHRDGTALVVKKDSPYQKFSDLRGKKIAIPHRFSNQRILIAKLIEEHGMLESDVTLLDYPPPEMPAGLKNDQFEAYIVGEPFCAKAEMDGFGRVMYFTSCVAVVTEKLIESNPDLVQELVSGITASGEWIDTQDQRLLPGLVKEEHASEMQKADENTIVIPSDFGQTSRMQAALVASQKKYYNQDPKLLAFVLSKPIDRVKYTNLNLAESDFLEIQRYAEKLGYFDDRPVTPEDPFGFKDYCDTRFETAPHQPVPLQDAK
jgi:NitT/TauT family transport system substrate-binding protein